MEEAQVARCWDGNAETWARHVRAGYDRYRELLNNPAFFALAGNLAGLEVLDAGCGEGYNTREFARRGARVTAVDLSPRMVALAQAEEERAPLGIRYLVASIGDLASFAPDSFDAVLSTMALMDCPDYEGAVREFARVLRPGGRLVFNVVHPLLKGLAEWIEEDGRAVGARLNNYFAIEPVSEQWKFSAAPDAQEVAPFTLVYFDRTVSGYLNPLCRAGFRLEEVVEPYPDDAACRSLPGLAKHRLIPQSLCVRARLEAMP